MRLFDVRNGRFTRSTNRNYVDVPKNDLLMAELTLKEMFELPVDEQLVLRVTSTNDYENLLDDMAERILVAEGPRMGFGFVTGEVARILREDPKNGGFGQALPMSSQFGYQFEKAYITTGNFQALAEVIPMVSGLENNRFMPTITILNGLRSNTHGWEFAFGPIVELTKTLDGKLDSRGVYSLSTALVFSVGKTVKSGEMNFPINAYLIPPKSENSWRFGLSMGWNAAKKKRLMDY